MPIVVALAIRFLIITVVQLGLVSLIEKYVLPYINNAIIEIIKTFGVSEEEATDIMANEIIQYAESIGIFTAVLATKMPIKVAERLGFTSKGYKLRTITGNGPKTPTGAGVKAKLTLKDAVILNSEEATAVVEQAVKSKTGFKIAYDMILKTVGVVFLGFMTVGNWLDFGNWNSGAYQKTMQKFIAWISFGKIVPDADYRQSKTTSPSVFTKVFETFKLGGAVGIQDPYKGVEVPFTRENMLDLLDQVGATLLLTTGAASTKNVLKATLPMIIFIAGNEDKIDNINYSNNTSVITQSVAVPAITKVFTGIVSQGVVGQGLVFTPRPDDIIESADELRQAAANNLAPYLNTLLGKIVYEVKVVSRIVNKEGFVQTGATQRIKTGTYANGTPKYKTVTNKFATLVVYALTDKGSRAKLTTIVLGPTDSAKLTIAQNDLRTLEGELPKLITTNDISDIKELATPTDIKITNTTETKYEEKASVKITPTNIAYYQNAGYKIIARGANNSIVEGFAPIGGSVLPPDANGKAPDDSSNKFNTATGQPNPNYKEPSVVPAPITTPLVSTTATKPTGAEANATTLFEWFQAQGQDLPSVSVRSVLYEEKGLGQRSYYTGTAEQNTKLLQALKSATNVATFLPPAFNPSINGNALQAL